MDYVNNKERFVSLLRSTDRDGVEDLIDYLESSDFFEAPASTCFHLAKRGGLCQHSLNVLDEALKILSVYGDDMKDIPYESVVLCSLLHDVCKANMYSVEKRNRKNKAGQWESYDAYTIDEKFRFGGHGSKSVFIVSRYIRLTVDEAVAINAHMSSWEDGGKQMGGVYEQRPFAWALHVADEAATFLKEGDKKDE